MGETGYQHGLGTCQKTIKSRTYMQPQRLARFTSRCIMSALNEVYQNERIGLAYQTQGRNLMHAPRFPDPLAAGLS
jgi:hypothetical protein